MNDPRRPILDAVAAARKRLLTIDEAHRLHEVLDALEVPHETLHEKEWR